jgi:vacuolar-type H+-ATPase subunit F/Vma7
METSSVSGCCEATILYNLGGAHGFPTAKDQETFDKSILYQISDFNRVIIAITNDAQRKVQEYLKNQGWATQKQGTLYVHSIRKADLRKYFDSLIAKKEPEIKKTYSGKIYAADVLNILGLPRDTNQHYSKRVWFRDLSNSTDMRICVDIEKIYGIRMTTVRNFNTVSQLRTHIYNKVSGRRS